MTDMLAIIRADKYTPELNLFIFKTQITCCCSTEAMQKRYDNFARERGLQQISMYTRVRKQMQIILHEINYLIGNAETSRILSWLQPTAMHGLIHNMRESKDFHDLLHAIWYMCANLYGDRKINAKFLRKHFTDYVAQIQLLNRLSQADHERRRKMNLYREISNVLISNDQLLELCNSKLYRVMSKKYDVVPENEEKEFLENFFSYGDFYIEI